MILGAIKKINHLLGVTGYFSEQNQGILLIFWNMDQGKCNMEGEIN